MTGDYSSDLALWKSLDAGIEIAKQFLLEILTPPARELGEVLADKVRSYRLRKQVGILSAARERIAGAGVSPRKIPLKTLVTLLEAGSLEEDESMLDRWANLLASAVNPTSTSDVETGYMGYIETLRQLSPKEALIMDRLYDYYRETGGPRKALSPFVIRGDVGIELTGQELQTRSGLPAKDFEMAMDNLVRLNLLTHADTLLRNPQPGDKYYTGTNLNQVQFTRFGFNFVSVCRGEDH